MAMAMNINTMSAFTMEKLVKASPINVNEERKCTECGNVIYEKEMFMLCDLKVNNDKIQKNICCDCFKEKVEKDIQGIEKWYKKTIFELAGMLSPIQEYMNSETKKQLDMNRKMLEKIEGEGGL
jgi:hypothetical protein